MDNNAELRITFTDLMNITNGVPGFAPCDSFNHLMVLIIRYLYSLNASLPQTAENRLLHDRIVRNVAIFNIFLDRNERITRTIANIPLTAWNPVTDDFHRSDASIQSFLLNGVNVNTFFAANPRAHELEGSRSILFLLRIFLVNAGVRLVSHYNQNGQHPLLEKINRITAYVDIFIHDLGQQIGPLPPTPRQ